LLNQIAVFRDFVFSKVKSYGGSIKKQFKIFLEYNYYYYQRNLEHQSKQYLSTFF